ncbi:MAG: toll/interleukin-1 receptor domain-containing protein [Gammaproteobacteria bacterium]|nr:toll/interleukin-1 receptor domain-containing protein [Gammaproteobacteria bacterium]
MRDLFRPAVLQQTLAKNGRAVFKGGDVGERIFISYRRADTAGHAGRISDALQHRFGRSVVFLDVDSIAAGVDFVQTLAAAIEGADVVLILIGNTWLESHDTNGARRLDNPHDPVRQEIEAALQRPGLTVIPVLVEGVRMPSAADLPPSMARLSRLQAIELSEQRWDFDLRRLGDAITATSGAGFARTARRWIAAVAVVVGVAAVTGWNLYFRGPSPDEVKGVWYLANGSFWTVTSQDGALWVDETHYESHDVWKHGPATLNRHGMEVDLDLVFAREPFRYHYTLRLDGDDQLLTGTVQRTDQTAGSPARLTRQKP